MDVKTLVKRVPTKTDFISFDAKKCNTCGRCFVVCTVGLWMKRGKSVKLAEDYKSRCFECGACHQVCELGAIRFQYPPGGTGVVYERG